MLSLFCIKQIECIACKIFIVGVVHSLDSSPQPAVDLEAYTLDSFALDDNFVDDNQHGMLDSLQLQVVRMAVVALDIAASKCFGQLAAVLALASPEAEDLALKIVNMLVKII